MKSGNRQLRKTAIAQLTEGKEEAIRTGSFVAIFIAMKIEEWRRSVENFPHAAGGNKIILPHAGRQMGNP
jgi:hypothetical protein